MSIWERDIWLTISFPKKYYFILDKRVELCYSSNNDTEVSKS